MLNLSAPTHIALPDEAATLRLGAELAGHLKAGDVVYLLGGLGMGKSTLSRGLIRALTHPEQDVPSPTFTLMQTYETPGFDVVHLDLYRLTHPEEVYELGLDEMLAQSVLLIEWPERLGHLGFDDRLEITLEQPTETQKGRVAQVTPQGRFRP